jgi:hypothetical protein
MSTRQDWYHRLVDGGPRRLSQPRARTQNHSLGIQKINNFSSTVQERLGSVGHAYRCHNQNQGRVSSPQGARYWTDRDTKSVVHADRGTVQDILAQTIDQSSGTISTLFGQVESST